MLHLVASVCDFQSRIHECKDESGESAVHEACDAEECTPIEIKGDNTHFASQSSEGTESNHIKCVEITDSLHNVDGTVASAGKTFCCDPHCSALSSIVSMAFVSENSECSHNLEGSDISTRRNQNLSLGEVSVKTLIGSSDSMLPDAVLQLSSRSHNDSIMTDSGISELAATESDQSDSLEQENEKSLHKDDVCSENEPSTIDTGSDRGGLEDFQQIGPVNSPSSHGDLSWYDFQSNDFFIDFSLSNDDIPFVEFDPFNKCDFLSLGSQDPQKNTAINHYDPSANDFYKPCESYSSFSSQACLKGMKNKEGKNDHLLRSKEDTQEVLENMTCFASPWSEDLDMQVTSVVPESDAYNQVTVIDYNFVMHDETWGYSSHEPFFDVITGERILSTIYEFEVSSEEDTESIMMTEPICSTDELSNNHISGEDSDHTRENMTEENISGKDYLAECIEAESGAGGVVGGGGDDSTLASHTLQDPDKENTIFADLDRFRDTFVANSIKENLFLKLSMDTVGRLPACNQTDTVDNSSPVTPSENTENNEKEKHDPLHQSDSSTGNTQDGVHNIAAGNDFNNELVVNVDGYKSVDTRDILNSTTLDNNFMLVPGSTTEVSHCGDVTLSDTVCDTSLTDLDYHVVFGAGNDDTPSSITADSSHIEKSITTDENNFCSDCTSLEHPKVELVGGNTKEIERSDTVEDMNSDFTLATERVETVGSMNDTQTAVATVDDLGTSTCTDNTETTALNTGTGEQCNTESEEESLSYNVGQLHMPDDNMTIVNDQGKSHGNVPNRVVSMVNSLGEYIHAGAGIPGQEERRSESSEIHDTSSCSESTKDTDDIVSATNVEEEIVNNTNNDHGTEYEDNQLVTDKKDEPHHTSSSQTVNIARENSGKSDTLNPENETTELTLPDFIPPASLLEEIITQQENVVPDNNNTYYSFVEENLEFSQLYNNTTSAEQETVPLHRSDDNDDTDVSENIMSGELSKLDVQLLSPNPQIVSFGSLLSDDPQDVKCPTPIESDNQTCEGLASGTIKILTLKPVQPDIFDLPPSKPERRIFRPCAKQQDLIAPDAHIPELPKLCDSIANADTSMDGPTRPVRRKEKLWHQCKSTYSSDGSKEDPGDQNNQTENQPEGCGRSASANSEGGENVYKELSLHLASHDNLENNQLNGNIDIDLQSMAHDFKLKEGIEIKNVAEICESTHTSLSREVVEIMSLQVKESDSDDASNSEELPQVELYMVMDVEANKELESHKMISNSNENCSEIITDTDEIQQNVDLLEFDLFQHTNTDAAISCINNTANVIGIVDDSVQYNPQSQEVLSLSAQEDSQSNTPTSCSTPNNPLPPRRKKQSFPMNAPSDENELTTTADFSIITHNWEQDHDPPVIPVRKKKQFYSLPRKVRQATPTPNPRRLVKRTASTATCRPAQGIAQQKLSRSDILSALKNEERTRHQDEIDLKNPLNVRNKDNALDTSGMQQIKVADKNIRARTLSEGEDKEERSRRTSFRRTGSLKEKLYYTLQHNFAKAPLPKSEKGKKYLPRLFNRKQKSYDIKQSEIIFGEKPEFRESSRYLIEKSREPSRSIFKACIGSSGSEHNTMKSQSMKNSVTETETSSEIKEKDMPFVPIRRRKKSKHKDDNTENLMRQDGNRDVEIIDETLMTTRLRNFTESDSLEAQPNLHDNSSEMNSSTFLSSLENDVDSADKEREQIPEDTTHCNTSLYEESKLPSLLFTTTPDDHLSANFISGTHITSEAADNPDTIESKTGKSVKEDNEATSLSVPTHTLLELLTWERPSVPLQTWAERQGDPGLEFPTLNLRHDPDEESAATNQESGLSSNEYSRDTPSPGPPVDSEKDATRQPHKQKREEDRTQKDRCVEVYPETVRQRQRKMMAAANKVDIKNWSSSGGNNNNSDTLSSPAKVKKFLPSVKALRSQFEAGKTNNNNRQETNGNVVTNGSNTGANGSGTTSLAQSRKSSSSTSSLASSTLEKTSSTNSLISPSASVENLVSPQPPDSVRHVDHDDPVEPIYNQFQMVDEELKELMSKPPSTLGWNPRSLLKRLYYIPEAPRMQSQGTTYINIEGYLEKLPSGRKKATFWNAWKRRYFVAKDGVLYYYQGTQTEKPSMKMTLMGGRVECMEPNMVGVDDGSRDTKASSMLGIDDGKGHYVVVRCSSRQEAERWRRALETHTVEDFASQYVQPWPIPTNPTLLRDILVIDIGSASIRAGVLASQATLPQLFMPTAVANSRDGRRQVWGFDALAPEVRSTSSVGFPIRPSHKISKYSVDLSAVSSILQKTFADLKVDPKNYHIQLSVPRVLNTNTQAELLRVLFDKHGVRSINLTHQSILALYAYNATSGIVVDVGERMDIVPVIDGYIVDGGVSRVPYGGYRILDHLRQFLYMRNVSLINEVESYIIRHVLENICYCAHHYNTEKARCTTNSDTFEKSVPLSEYFSKECPYESISLDFGRFQATEGLFNPDAWGLDHPGLHKLVHKAIMECSMDIRKEMSRSIFLAGGVTQLPGLVDRLTTEIDNLTPPAIRPKVHASPYRYHAAYIGACILAESPAFTQSRIMREDWNKYGNVALRKWSL